MSRRKSSAGNGKKRLARGRESLLTPTIYCGDNVACLTDFPDASIDLIYIDPPFNSDRDYELSSTTSQRKPAFADRFDSIRSYIDFMRPRCEQLRRVLKQTGSFYYHCDWHASHYVKVMLDEIFGASSFINEIIWAYASGGRALHHFHRKHDVLFLYSPGAQQKTYTFNADAISRPRNECDSCGTTLAKWNNMKKLADADGRLFRTIKSAGKIYKYYDDEPVTPSDVWHISHLQQKDPERLGYPTQKPLELLHRCIKASSNPGDIVLDAFCGCGTTLVAAQQLGRQWIGIDIAPAACNLTAQRLRDVCSLPEDQKHQGDGSGFVIRNLPGYGDPDSDVTATSRPSRHRDESVILPA